MNHTQIIILSGIGLYFLLMLFFALQASRRQTHEGFVIGSRSVGYIPTIGSLAASFRDGMGVVFWLGFGVAAGYGGLWFIVGIILSFALYIVLGPNVRQRASEGGAITIGEMVRSTVGRVSEKVSAGTVLFFALIVIAVQLFVSGNIFAEVLGTSSWIGVFSVACVVGGYLFFGGYSNVVKTDTVQFFLIIAFITIPFFAPPAKEDILDFGSFLEMPLKDGVALFFLGLFYPLSAAEIWQRVFSAKNKKVIQVSFPAAGIALAIMTLSLIWLGMASKLLLTGEVPDGQILFELFNQNALSPWVLCFIAIVVMAVTMSTLDTFCYLFAASLAKNFVSTKITKSREDYIKFSKTVMLVALALMGFFALTISDVIQVILDAMSLLFVLVPLYVVTALGLIKDKSKRLDLLLAVSIAASILTYIVMFIRGDFANMIMLLVPVALSTSLTAFSIIFDRCFLKQRA